MKIFFLAFVSLFVFCQIVFGQANDPRFSIHLLSPKIKSNQLAAINLKNLRPSGKPLLAFSEITSYLKDKHEIRFNYSAVEALRKTKRDFKGRSFAVFVNGEAIYAGAFWSGIYSQSFDGVYINLDELHDDFPMVTLKLGYPTAKFFTGQDPRADERIFAELEKDGLLYEEVKVIGKCREIHATGKRHQSWFFTFSLDSTVRGKYPDKEIRFERYADFGGIKLLELLEAFKDLEEGESPSNAFNPKKEIILLFQAQVTVNRPKVISVDFLDQ
jgi:hypothetical protein